MTWWGIIPAMALTPQTVLNDYIVEALRALGGSATRAAVLAEIDRRHHRDWTEDDLLPPVSKPQSELNWHNRASWERTRMMTSGELVRDQHGIWTLPASRRPEVARPRLGMLTSTDAINQALEEFKALGQEAFLTKYGFGESRDYFVRANDVLADSKAIVAAGLSIQYPDLEQLKPKDFSGGAGGAVTALERLGFDVVSRAQLHPPTLGMSFPNRSAIADAFGGDKVQGIIKFPGEDVANVFSDADGPYSDDAPTLTEPFGYRGAGLSGAQRVEARGNKLLERAWKERAPVRFWFKPVGGPFVFQSWAAVLGRAWIDGVGQDGQRRPEIEWMLQAVPDSQPENWPNELAQALDDTAATGATDDPLPEELPGASYAQLCARVEAVGQPKRPSGVVRVNYARSVAARRAVLLRSAGACESPWCTGVPAEPSRSGEPILEVDHVLDLALGGQDHPSNMVALCPNCHAVKTRGRDQARYRRVLSAVARGGHKSALSAQAP